MAVRLDGQLVRRFVYGASLWPQARVDAAGDVLERYVYASQAHVPDVIVRRDGQRLRLVLDVTGSVRAAVDADSGVVLQRLSYDAYGRVTQDTNPGLQPFGYKGAFSDPVAEGAGLVWMGVRAYTPKLARFTTADPVGLKAGWNQHDALASDPVNMIDADGRFAIVVPMVVVGGAAVLGWLSTRDSDPDAIGTAATDLWNAADRAGDALWNVLDECIDFAKKGQDGDLHPDIPPSAVPLDQAGKAIGAAYPGSGISDKEYGRAAHRAKGKAGLPATADVRIDPETGELYDNQTGEPADANVFDDGNPKRDARR